MIFVRFDRMFLFYSVIFFVSIVDVVMYCVSIGYGIQTSETQLLAPTVATLNMLGMKVYIFIKLKIIMT